jgi:hypothetical protein
MGRTATSRPGRTEGYVLAEALVAILASALVAASALPAAGAAARGAEAALSRSSAAAAAWNARVLGGLDDLAP